MWSFRWRNGRPQHGHIQRYWQQVIINDISLRSWPLCRTRSHLSISNQSSSAQSEFLLVYVAQLFVFAAKLLVFSSCWTLHLQQSPSLPPDTFYHQRHPPVHPPCRPWWPFSLIKTASRIWIFSKWSLSPLSTFTTTIIAMLSFQSFNVQLLTATMKKTESRIVISSHHDNQRKDPSASRHSQCFPTHSASCRQVSEQYKLSLTLRFRETRVGQSQSASG